MAYGLLLALLLTDVLLLGFRRPPFAVSHVPPGNLRRWAQFTSSRAERLFENLRRVEIRLNYLEPYRGGKVTLYDLVHEPTCADDLIAAAESKWGPRIPLLKPDPPLCN